MGKSRFISKIELLAELDKTRAEMNRVEMLQSTGWREHSKKLLERVTYLDRQFYLMAMNESDGFEPSVRVDYA